MCECVRQRGLAQNSCSSCKYPIRVYVFRGHTAQSEHISNIYPQR